MRTCLLGLPRLLARDGEVEVGIGIGRVERDRLAIAAPGLRIAPQVVKDVAQVEVRLEHLAIETDRTLVECLRFDDLVARE